MGHKWQGYARATRWSGQRPTQGGGAVPSGWSDAAGPVSVYPPGAELLAAFALPFVAVFTLDLSQLDGGAVLA